MEYILGGSGGEFIYHLSAATGCDGWTEIDVSPVANLYFDLKKSSLSAKKSILHIKLKSLGISKIKKWN
jgi:hypothetical protein